MVGPFMFEQGGERVGGNLNVLALKKRKKRRLKIQENEEVSDGESP